MTEPFTLHEVDVPAKVHRPVTADSNAEKIGVRAFLDLEDLAIKGDWPSRVLALSAIGRMIREDPTAWRPSPIRHLGWHLPFLRALFPTVGRRGVFVRGPLINALNDRAWIVRMAAALALGECRDIQLTAVLKPLLLDHYRPVRAAAASALLAAGSSDVINLQLEGEPAPRTIGDSAKAREWVSRLLVNHTSVASGLATLSPPGASISGDLTALTLLFTRDPPEYIPTDSSAEAARYAHEADNHHNLAKPFTPGPRDQNTRLLHSFLSLTEHMDVPYNGRILDLCGGAGWVSELLSKLGYSPVTVDVSQALLKLATQRFNRETLTPRVAAADVLALPFREGVFDAVVVFDALHHIGDVPAVLREVFRVLADGGQFLLAEPGEGHSETEKSRGESTEYGVHEGEIHVFETSELATAIGFTDPRVVPHYIPAVYFTPHDLRHAIAHPVERWRIRHRTGTMGRMDEYILQSVFSHPIIAFTKGTRAIDSRAPRTLKAHLTADIVREGPHVRGMVHITNTGDTLWLCGGGTGKVRLGVQLLSPARTIVNRDYARHDLSANVAANAAIDVALRLVLPDAHSQYVLKLDLVNESICWFEDVGSVPLYLAI